MKFTLESSNINDYLKKTPIIDYDHIDIKKLAQKIDKQSGSRLDYIKNAYEYVRDKIAHSADISEEQVTCTCLRGT
ncbi:MAG TPA: hypothetical protein PLC16_00565 [Defluviitaleaceae bacterium]|nr:hypothetical protein [Defluviitaleaceae bacterium]